MDRARLWLIQLRAESDTSSGLRSGLKRTLKDMGNEQSAPLDDKSGRPASVFGDRLQLDAMAQRQQSLLSQRIFRCLGRCTCVVAGPAIAGPCGRALRSDPWVLSQGRWMTCGC